MLDLERPSSMAHQSWVLLMASMLPVLDLDRRNEQHDVPMVDLDEVMVWVMDLHNLEPELSLLLWCHVSRVGSNMHDLERELSLFRPFVTYIR